MPAGENANTTPITADDLLGRLTSDAYTVVKTVRILVAPHELVDRHAELEARLRRTQEQDVSIDSGAPQIARELVEVEDQLEAFNVAFRFRALSRKAWADLIAAHPPTKEQLKLDRRADFNLVTFPAAAIAACCVEPVLTPEQVAVLEDGVDGVGGLTDAQFNTLFNAAVEVNVSGLAAPKSVAAHLLRMSGASVLPLTTTESLDPSFLDG